MKRSTAVITILVVMIVVAMLVLLSVMNPPGGTEDDRYPRTTRAERIPDDAVKMTPQTDAYPCVLRSDEWYDPVPLEGPINTAGAEDSAFITPDGRTMYFFFTPDAGVPANEQLFDEVTGIWCSEWNGSSWSEPERVWLQDPGKLALDGAAFVLGDAMWFASAREGYVDMNLFTATLDGGRWTDWTYAGDLLNQQYKMGEMHISSDGKVIFFHSERSGGNGGLDLWTTRYENGTWSEPQNIAAVNSAEDDGYPFVSPDGDELWFTRTYLGSPSIWRSMLTNGTWSTPELIVSSFAAEPTLDADGDLYFIHHFVKDGEIIEADVYVAYRK